LRRPLEPPNTRPRRTPTSSRAMGSGPA
jgi:hypothetical protein